VTRLGSLLLGPKEVFTLIVDTEAPPGTTSTHQRRLRLSDSILGSEVRGLESGILGDLRNLVQLESGDLSSNERKEDEEGGEVLHGGRGRTGRGLKRRLRTGTTWDPKETHLRYPK